MDEPGYWGIAFALVFVILTTFFSIIYLTLRNVSWGRLAESFARRGHPEREQILHQRQGELICSMGTLRLLANLAFLLCVVDYYIAAQGAQASGSVIPLLKAFLVSGIILSVFSIAIPHAWAKYAGTSILVHSYRLIIGMELIIRPVGKVLHLFDPLVRWLSGVGKENDNSSLEYKQEELLNVFAEGEKQGLVDEVEKDMIASVLEFRNTTAEEIMTPRTEVIGVEADAPLAQALAIVIQEGHSRYPVYEGDIDKIIGMLYAKDLLVKLKQPESTSELRKLMRKAYFVPQNKTLRDLLHEFQKQKVHLAVVLDEYGGTAGIVTIEDILEEIVGEISDEYELPETEPIKKIDEHTYELDGRLKVDELNDEFDMRIPEDEDYDTVGGFIFSKLGYIPQTGESFAHENLQITVLDAGERKINRVRIAVKPKQAKTDEP